MLPAVPQKKLRNLSQYMFYLIHLLFQRAPYRIAHYSGCCSLGWLNHIRAVYLLQSWWLTDLISHLNLCERVCKCVCLTDALVESSRLVNNFPVCAIVLRIVDVRGQTWPDQPPPLTLCRAGALSCPIFLAPWLPGEDSGIGRGPQGSTESLSSAAAVQAGTSADCLRVSDAG